MLAKCFTVIDNGEAQTKPLSGYAIYVAVCGLMNDQALPGIVT